MMETTRQMALSLLINAYQYLNQSPLADNLQVYGPRIETQILSESLPLYHNLSHPCTVGCSILAMDYLDENGMLFGANKQVIHDAEINKKSSSHQNHRNIKANSAYLNSDRYALLANDISLITRWVETSFLHLKRHFRKLFFCCQMKNSSQSNQLQFKNGGTRLPSVNELLSAIESCYVDVGLSLEQFAFIEITGL